MGELQYLLIKVAGLGVTVFVPVVVWVMLTAGIYQLVRAKIHQFRLIPRAFRRKVQAVYSHQIG